MTNDPARMAQRFRKKPVEIQAMLLTEDNPKDVCDWVHVGLDHLADESDVGYHSDGRVVIHTPEGDMTADVGDYVIRGVQGEFYPCKPSIFEQTYERVALPVVECPHCDLPAGHDEECVTW